MTVIVLIHILDQELLQQKIMLRPCPNWRLRLQLRLGRARLLFFNTDNSDTALQCCTKQKLARYQFCNLSFNVWWGIGCWWSSNSPVSLGFGGPGLDPSMTMLCMGQTLLVGKQHRVVHWTNAMRHATISPRRDGPSFCPPVMEVPLCNLHFS